MDKPPRLWIVRVWVVACLVACGGIVVMLALHRSTGPVIGPYSVPALAALVLATVATGALLLLSVLPGAALKRLVDWSKAGLCSLQSPHRAGTRTQGLVLAALAVSCYVCMGWKSIRDNEPLLYDDQRQYLKLASEIRQMGGLGALWDGLWAGTYREANQHPLYPAMLSVLPSHEQFRWAKWLSFGLGLLPLGIVWCTIAQRDGWLTGGVAAALLAGNATFQQSTSKAACEILLTTWVLLAWFAVSSGNFRGATRHLLMGAWLGLAYLTKATALLLLAGSMLWIVVLPAMRRWGWLAVLAFAITASPLLVRNTRSFGNPVYNDNTRYLFADRFEPDREFSDTWTELKAYWHAHSVGSIARRALGGLGWEGFILLRSLAPRSLGSSGALVGLVIALCVVLGVGVRPGEPVGLLAIWCGMFYVCFAWYVPIAAGDRFWAPLVPPLLVFAARGGTALIGANTVSPKLAGRRVVWAAVLWCVAVTALTYLPGRAG